MRLTQRETVLRLTGAIGLVVVCLGWITSRLTLVATGVAALGFAAARFFASRRARRATPHATPASEAALRREAPRPKANPSDTQGLVEEMLAQGRYSLLLRPQVVGNLSEDQFRRAHEALTESMALVPEGEVVLGPIDRALDDGKLDDDEIASHHGSVVHVAGLFLDRFPVTNLQFHEFVAGGGYEQMSIWDPHIWPAVLDFVDLTGQHGPRYWKHGNYAAGQDHHPVVGICWYEAAAYARWLGKRLPGDAEWVKAGSWPVPLSSTSRIQRKYPWGDSMDRNRCNLWGSGPGTTVPVNEFAQGMSVGGVHQLIGNVWEWTSSNFGAGGVGADFTLPTPMKSIRGGAFDTYFENQASCHFQSGEKPVARKHNIGFRCAVSLRDLTMHYGQGSENDSDAAPSPEEESHVQEEVFA